MMDQEKAAKYFIVGWIKNWNLYTYLQVVTGKSKPNVQDAHKIYSWLPTDKVNFIRKEIKRYVADNIPKLSEKLFNENDNLKKLEFYKLAMVKIGEKSTNKFDKARKAYLDERRFYHANNKTNELSVEQMRRGSGHSWNVCK